MRVSVFKTEYFRDIVNIHSKSDVLFGFKGKVEKKMEQVPSGSPNQ